MKLFVAVVLFLLIVGLCASVQAQYSGYCPTCAVIVYNACWGPAPCANSAQSAGIGPLMMAHPSNNTRYRFSFAASQATPGSGCTNTSSLTVTLSYTDADSSQPMTSDVLGFEGNGTPAIVPMWTIPKNTQDNTSAFRTFPVEFNAAAGFDVQFTATYTAAFGCTPKPTYTFYPHLEQLP